MKDKYNLTVDENIFIAKRNIVDYIYQSANLEGIAITYPETDALFNNVQVAGVKLSDGIAVNNLKRAWKFLLDIDTLEYETDLAFMAHVNRLVGGDNAVHLAGNLRTLDVKVTLGNDEYYTPKIPNKEKVQAEIQEIMQIENTTERAITLMLYGMRGQFFYDGNKRTSMLCANHEMIAGGAGIISVPIKQQQTFRELLVQFYTSNDMSEIKQFVYDNCIDGMHLEQVRDTNNSLVDDLKLKKKSIKETGKKPINKSKQDLER